MQPLEQRAGVTHIPANRGVGPGAVRIAEEAKVQLDQAGNVGDRLVVVAQLLQSLLRELRTDDVVVVEGHDAARLRALRGRFADVVHEGCQPQDEVG